MRLNPRPYGSLVQIALLNVVLTVDGELVDVGVGYGTIRQIRHLTVLQPSLRHLNACATAEQGHQAQADQPIPDAY